ncbi:DUF2515 family protein [Salipaludibacillus sp. HK11]|uniref:DUF2515 family protein n=1 Tax=Salipaludibacillus sp. HK11 TaxID=3394320 RepID=UPI0039FCE0F0
MNDQQLVKKIQRLTIKNNKDNISRTYAYQRYYFSHQEIRWAYLASFVSRNAGWSMSDLMTNALVNMISNEWRRRLFITFERINWLIFSDVYPQLIIYEWSKKKEYPLFDKLRLFQVSQWMIDQWWIFWNKKDKNQLMDALIINEQHVIEKPVICAPLFKEALFTRAVYEWQERLHFSVVIFPTLDGELFGTSVRNFTNVNERVILGKTLAWMLFDSEESESIMKYFIKHEFTANRANDIPYLHQEEGDKFTFRILCPQVLHHDESRRDWSTDKRFHPQLLLAKKPKIPRKYCLTAWYEKKQLQIDVASKLISYVKKAGT